MKALGLSIVVASLVIGPAAAAKNQPKQPVSEGVKQLQRALATVAEAAQGPKGPGHFNPKTDRDQGDDHANPGAILRVCSKDTPAAHRSAICPIGVSPN